MAEMYTMIPMMLLSPGRRGRGSGSGWRERTEEEEAPTCRHEEDAGAEDDVVAGPVELAGGDAKTSHEEQDHAEDGEDAGGPHRTWGGGGGGGGDKKHHQLQRLHQPHKRCWFRVKLRPLMSDVLSDGSALPWLQAGYLVTR